MKEFCEYSGTPLFEDWIIGKGDQNWHTDVSGKHKYYGAKVGFKSPDVKEECNWVKRVTQFLKRWWVAIPLPFFLRLVYAPASDRAIAIQMQRSVERHW
jgi:hypothetical protein